MPCRSKAALHKTHEGRSDLTEELGPAPAWFSSDAVDLLAALRAYVDSHLPTLGPGSVSLTWPLPVLVN